jgi:hypothetical protein
MRTQKHVLLFGAAWMGMLLIAGCRKNNDAPATPAAADPAAIVEDGSVLTPVGYMDKSKVHYIAPGFHLNVANGHLQKVESATGRLVEDFGEVKPLETKYNLALRGTLGNIDNSATTGSRVVPYVQGWIAYSYWTNTNTSNPITNFTTNWVVPSVPSNKGSQTIFLFNGMQNGTTSASYIIQPVLQWGPSAAGGGKYWSITNWYVSSSSAFYGSLVNVSTGTTLKGILKQTAVSGSNYSYNSSFSGYPASNALQINNVPQAYWASETLESYGVSTPSTMYPPNSYVAMSSIVMQQGSAYAPLSWSTAQATAGSAQKAVVVSNSASNGEVDIYFR